MGQVQQEQSDSKEFGFVFRGVPCQVPPTGVCVPAQRKWEPPSVSQLILSPDRHYLYVSKGHTNVPG